ncbi:MAG: hypothetical protein R6U15_00955 [Candidatus Izemoplasmatales bacterium]
MIKRKPFEPTILEEDRDLRENTLTIRLNQFERINLNKDKKIINQSKDSTAIKQLMEIGRIVLHNESTGKIINTLFINNKRNNRNY